MSILTTLFGIVPPEKPPELSSIYPNQAAQYVQKGKLPTIQVDKLILNQGEVCHFVDVAAAITEKKRYKSVRSGGSYRIFKGYTAHLGRSESVPVAESEYTKGIFFITNQRIVFVANKNGFEQKISKLTAITPYSDGIGLQFNGKSYMLLLPNGENAKLVLDLII